MAEENCSKIILFAIACELILFDNLKEFYGLISMQLPMAGR